MIINVDAKALEWCTYLFLSQDKVGLEEWQAVVDDPTKNDVHRANQAAFNLPSRLVAKVFLFRWIYRGSAYAYSKDPDFTPVSTSVDFWQDVIDKYYAKYPSIYKTHKDYLERATKTGLITSPFGRVYEFHPFVKPNGETKWNESDIVNWPNQGCGADVMAVARIAIRQRARRLKLEGKLISTVHDSVVADAPSKEKDAWCELFSQVFVDLPQLVTKSYDVEWNVPMVGEVSVGNNMLDLEEVKI